MPGHTGQGMDRRYWLDYVLSMAMRAIGDQWLLMVKNKGGCETCAEARIDDYMHAHT